MERFKDVNEKICEHKFEKQLSKSAIAYHCLVLDCWKEHEKCTCVVFNVLSDFQ